MALSDKRKFDRLPARLEVEIRTRGRGQICPSVNVSRHGMFLATANPPHERQLLILRVPVPDSGPPIDVMASVVRRMPAEEAAKRNMPTGMGINFFALTEENKIRWDQYLAKLRGERPAASDVSGLNSARATFLLQPKDVERLRLFTARELSLGSMFLRTPVLRQVGEKIKVILLHPVTDEEFPILARVRSVHTGSGTEPKGMTLDFEALSAAARGAVSDFVEHGEPPPSEDEIIGAPVVASASLPPPPPQSLDEPPHPTEEAIGDDLAEAATRVGVPIPEILRAATPEPPRETTAANDEGLGAAVAQADEEVLAALDAISMPEGDEKPKAPPLSPKAAPEIAPKASPAPKAPANRDEPRRVATPAVQQSPDSLIGLDIEGDTEPPPPPPPRSTPSLPLDPEKLAALRAAVATGPEDVGALFRLGSALAREGGGAAEAVQLLEKLQRLEPHHPLANGALALAYAQLGNRDTARKYLTRARRLGQPVDSQVAALLG